MQPVVIAIGGNALYNAKTGQNLDPERLAVVCKRLVGIYEAGFLPVVTFGNGPQVGNLLDMAETSARCADAPASLDVCVAWTQGEIGYRLQRALGNQLRAQGLATPVVALNTTVQIHPGDPAFQKPTKPVGRFISPEEAQALYQTRGWVVGPDANRGYRRLVPSPKPQQILEAEAIAALIAKGFIVLCCGGGGIPVAASGAGPAAPEEYIGIEAVIDKDYTSCLLAEQLGIPNLLICTEVANVYLHFGTPQQQALHTVSLEAAKTYMEAGHFASGSMGPKVAALIRFLEAGGQRAFITSLDMAQEALTGEAGTVFVRSAAPQTVPI
jgi:carbamate kinase